MAGISLAPRFDALDPGVVADPYPTYADLRAAGRVCRFAPASWGITRHADVAPLLRDPRLGNQFPADDPQFQVGEDPAGDAFRRIIPTQPAADHGRLHRLIVGAFSPGVARRLHQRIESLVDELLAPAMDTGRCDGAADLAFPLAATVVCELIGIPAAATAEIWPRIAALAKAFTPFVPEADRSSADEALIWMRGFVEDLVAHLRPDDDTLLGRLVAASAQDREEFPLPKVIDNVMFLCFTGFETTMNMVSTGCVGLSTHPDQWRLLRADPELCAPAVEEFVRFDAPIQFTARLALEPITVGDRLIRQGRSVFLMLGCANHDEAVFDQPDRLDISRHPNPHVGFGGGVRGCLGATLARVEGGVAFARLAGRLKLLEPAAPAVRAPNMLFRSYSSIPLAVRPA
jgi:cytochrome P450